MSSKTMNGDKRGKGIDDGEEGREGDNEEEEEENIETQESDERASLQEEVNTSVVLVTDADMHNADVMYSSIDEERSPRTKCRCFSHETISSGEGCWRKGGKASTKENVRGSGIGTSTGNAFKVWPGKEKV
ncbi:uncharacterized protein [Asterias amurensis]|uniref:uncharacterized protein n=1 Tax=Asterias amurensis TaxID=7602 RepID=UPI003AB3C6F5